MAITDTTFDALDTPLGRGGGGFPRGSSPAKIGLDGRFLFKLGVARDARKLPESVDCWTIVDGVEEGPVTIESALLLTNVARAWRELAFGNSQRKLPAVDFEGRPFHLRLERVGLGMAITSTKNEAYGSEVVALLDTHVVLETLEGLGNFVASRLPPHGLALQVWRDRMPSGSRGLRSLDADLAGLPQDKFEQLGIETANDMSDLIFPDDLRMAARSVGREIPLPCLRRALEIVRSRESQGTEQLDTLSAAFRSDIDLDFFGKPHELGQQVATWARKKFGISNESPVEIEKILETLKVEVIDMDLGTPLVEAIAAWGDYGPVILVNSSGLMSSSAFGRRATLAHEVCHFIVDRDGALPVAEASGQSVSTPLKIEQRANAFAAEFLLPRDVAGTYLRRFSDLDMAIDCITESFRVSRTIALWQLRNHPEDAGGPTPAQRRLIRKRLDSAQ